MGKEMADRASTGNLERSTPLHCRHCGAAFEAKNRNGKPKAFCRRLCKDRWGNAQRLKGAALLKGQKAPVQRRVNPGKRRVDLEVIPESERPALLVEAARRLGLIKEGPTLTAARQAALTPHHEVSA